MRGSQWKLNRQWLTLMLKPAALVVDTDKEKLPVLLVIPNGEHGVLMAVNDKALDVRPTTVVEGQAKLLQFVRFAHATGPRAINPKGLALGESTPAQLTLPPLR